MAKTKLEVVSKKYNDKDVLEVANFLEEVLKATEGKVNIYQTVSDIEELTSDFIYKLKAGDIIESGGSVWFVTFKDEYDCTFSTLDSNKVYYAYYTNTNNEWTFVSISNYDLSNTPRIYYVQDITDIDSDILANAKLGDMFVQDEKCYIETYNDSGEIDLVHSNGDEIICVVYLYSDNWAYDDTTTYVISSIEANLGTKLYKHHLQASGDSPFNYLDIISTSSVPLPDNISNIPSEFFKSIVCYKDNIITDYTNNYVYIKSLEFSWGTMKLSISSLNINDISHSEGVTYYGSGSTDTVTPL